MSDGDWFENEDFWQVMGPAMFGPERLAGTGEEVDQLLQLVGLESGAVLDVPCGPGRHAVELARRGFEVKGVDRTQSYLDQAKEAASAAGVDANVEWALMDMRELADSSRFDLVINLFSSFGYFSDEDNLALAKKMRTALKGKGVAVFEMLGKEILAAGFSPRRWHEIQGGVLLEDVQVSDDWARVENRWIYIGDDGKRFEHRFSHRIYSGLELRAVLWEAGFDDVDLFGSLDGIPYDTEAERLVVVARK
jgi:SAM-dependent methyltransferase